MSEIYEFVTSGQFLMPLAFLAASLALGFLAEKAVLRLLKKITSRSRWGAYTAVRSGLRGMITLLFLIAGLYFAIRLTDLSPDILVYYGGRGGGQPPPAPAQRHALEGPRGRCPRLPSSATCCA